MVEGKRQHPFPALPRVGVAGPPSGESEGAKQCALPPPKTVWAPAGFPAEAEVRRGQMGSPPVQKCAPLLLERAAIPEAARKQDSRPALQRLRAQPAWKAMRQAARAQKLPSPRRTLQRVCQQSAGAPSPQSLR